MWRRPQIIQCIRRTVFACGSLWNCSRSEDVIWGQRSFNVAQDTFVFTQFKECPRRPRQTSNEVEWSDLKCLLDAFTPGLESGPPGTDVKPGLNRVWVWCWRNAGVLNDKSPHPMVEFHWHPGPFLFIMVGFGCCSSDVLKTWLREGSGKKTTSNGGECYHTGICSIIKKCAWSIISGWGCLRVQKNELCWRGVLVSLSIDRSGFFMGRGASGDPSFSVIRAWATLTVLVCGGSTCWGGRGFGFLLKVCDYYSQISNSDLEMLSAAPVDVF